MNRRITKAMAEDAAFQMKKKAYIDRIENATDLLNEAGQKIVRMYIPGPVIACTEEYSQYIGYNTIALISTIRTTESGYNRREREICISLSFKIPIASKIIMVSPRHYETVRKLHDKVKELESKRDEFGKEVFKALVALKTEKAVEKELPEALKYLVFPEVKSVPMPVLTDLRKIIEHL